MRLFFAQNFEYFFSRMSDCDFMPQMCGHKFRYTMTFYMNCWKD